MTESKLHEAMRDYAEAVKAETVGVTDHSVDEDCRRLKHIGEYIAESAFFIYRRADEMNALSVRPKADHLTTLMLDAISDEFAGGGIGATAWAVVCAAAWGE